MNRVKLALSGFGAGAAFMYLSDPDRGKRRRALARDQAVKTWNDFSGLVDKAQRDLVNRSEGALCAAKALFRQPFSDLDVLVQRVRSRLGRLVSHPHAIEVTVEDSRIVLSGPILENDLDCLLRGARSVPGVK